MRALYKCPHCEKETDYLNKESKLAEDMPIKKSKYFIVHRIRNQEGKIVWFNLFRIKIMDLMFVISIVILLLGFWQINNQCKDYLADPCSYAAQTNKCTVLNISKEVFSYGDYQADIQSTGLPDN